MKSKIISLILVIGLLCPQGAWSLAPPSQAGETASLVQILSHRFPKYIREELESALIKEGYDAREINRIIWRGLTWTDGATIGFKDDKLFQISADVLNKVLKRPQDKQLTPDAVKAVLEYHEEIHRQIHNESKLLRKICDEMERQLGRNGLERLISYLQNQYGNFDNEQKAVEELVVSFYTEKIFGNPLRLLDDRDAVITIDQIDQRIALTIESFTKDIISRIDTAKLQYGSVLNELYIKSGYLQEPVRDPHQERLPSPKPPESPASDIKPGMQVKIKGSETLGIGTVISLKENRIIIEFASGRKELIFSVVRARLEVVPGSAEPAEPGVITLGQKLYEEMKVLMDRGKSRALWEVIAQEHSMTKEAVIREVILYLAKLYHGDLDKIAETLQMKTASLKANVLYKYRLMDEVKKTKDGTVQGEEKTGRKPISEEEMSPEPPLSTPAPAPIPASANMAPAPALPLPDTPAPLAATAAAVDKGPYREIGSRKLSESEIREGMHNKYLLDCLSNPKTRESAKEALKLMRNPEKIIDFLRALEPFLLYQKNVEKNMDILEILDAINIVNEQVIKRLRDFLNYGNDNVQQKARALLNKMNRSIHEEQDRQVLEQYKKGIHYLDDSEIREIESPLTLNKLYGRETRKFKEEFSGLKEDDIKDELTQAREQQLPIRELRKKLKDLAEFMKKTLSGSRPTVKKQMSPERSALLHRSWEFVKYTANVASRKGLSEKEMLDLVKKRFPEKSNEHILKHLRRAIETIERKRREILGDLEEDDGNDPRSFMRGRSMRDVYSSASLRYRLLYDFDLTLHDYNLILQDIETLICFDLKGEPIPQSISRTNLMLLKLELKRSTDREKLVLFTTKPNINIHAALKLLKLDGVEFIKREDYERLINGTDVASALITYTKAEDYPQYRVLTIEENYYLWVNILGRVIFTDERRYPVDPLLRRELKRIGLESLIQNDPKTGHYLDLLPEVPALGQIEEERLMEKIIADEA